MNALILLAAIALSSGPLAPQTPPTGLGDREVLILLQLDANRDAKISCEELAAYLEPKVLEAIRKLGVEPRLAPAVAPCGSRSTGRSVEASFPEFFRGLIYSAINSATSVSANDDAVQPGEIVELEIVALPPPLSGTIGALLPKGADKPDAKKPWTDHLEEWVDIRQSFLDEASIGKPAKLSLTDHGKGDETIKDGEAPRVYKFNTAVILTLPVEWRLTDRVSISPIAAFEVNVASNTPSKDKVVHRVGFSTLFVRKDGLKPFSSHHVQLTFDYSTDRRYNAKVYGGTVEYRPTWRKIGIGQYLGRSATVDFRWQPYLGIVWGEVKDAGEVSAYKDLTNFTHPFARVTGELKITDRFHVTPEVSVWRGKRTQDGVTINRQTAESVEFGLLLSESKGKERASITLSLDRGRSSPDFLNEKKTVLAFAFKF